jgi:hypothetical protein
MLVVLKLAAHQRLGVTRLLNVDVKPGRHVLVHELHLLDLVGRLSSQSHWAHAMTPHYRHYLLNESLLLHAHPEKSQQWQWILMKLLGVHVEAYYDSCLVELSPLLKADHVQSYPTETDRPWPYTVWMVKYS